MGILFAAENLRQVEAKLEERRISFAETPKSPTSPTKPITGAGMALSMGRAHSANTLLAIESIVQKTK